jgi:S4 domain protein YaaA
MSAKQKSPVIIHTPFIQLGQLLKLVGAIGHGGEAKTYLASHSVLVNGELEARRGRKLYPTYAIEVEGVLHTIQAI